MSNCKYLSVSKSRAVASFYEADLEFSKDSRYRKSYYQHKGVLYKTKYVHAQRLLPFEPEELEVLFDNLEHTLSLEEQNSIRLPQLKESLKKLHDETKRLPARIRERIFQNKLQDMFNVSIISSVSLEFASDITLFWCPECHRLYFPSEIQVDTQYCYPLCPHCSREGKRRILEQTPVWVSKGGDRHPILPLVTGAYGLNDVWKHWNRGELPPCPKCKEGRMRFYIHKDPARFLESSVLKCDNDNCGYEHRLYNSNYVLSLPTQHITRPIIGKTYNYLSIEEIKGLLETGSGDPQWNLKNNLDMPLIDTRYIEDFLYIPNIDIKKIVLGLVFGLKAKKTYPTKKTGIRINTSAIYLRLNEGYYSKAREFMEELNEELYEKKAPYLELGNNMKHVVLHSLAHALMGKLPNYSGLSLDSFEYIYSPSRNEVLIYEAGDGSLGALETLTQIDEATNEPIIVDYLQRVKEDITECSCDGACKYCLALPGCPEYNQNLDRFSLGPLFGIDDPRDMSG